MLTNPPLVPSKDALRVLRQLAFAGSTLAAIGVVTLNYNVYRQIRLAEQHLETKKQIRALSSGKGEAILARMIEAAENGQDFSIRAMREQRMSERCSRTSDSTSSAKPGWAEQEPDRSKRIQNDENRYLNSEQTAQRIRKATIKMTSMAPMHVYGHPRHFPGPTRYWPTDESREAQTLESEPSTASNNASYGSRQDAAKRIKKTILGMASVGLAQVYGRPKTAVPKAPPIRHGSIASWLSTASASPTSEDAAHEFVSSSLINTPGEMISQHRNLAPCSGSEVSQHAADEAFDQLGSSIAQSKTKPDESPSTGDSHAKKTFQQGHGQHIIEHSEDTFSRRSRSATTDRASTGPTTVAHETYQTWQPYHGIRIEPTTIEGEQPDLTSWPHLRSPAASHLYDAQDELLPSGNDEVAEEQRPVPPKDAKTQGEETHDERNQVMRHWTPFPRSSRRPERTTSGKNLERDPVPEHTPSPPDLEKGLGQPEQVRDQLARENSTMPGMTEVEMVDLASKIHKVFLRDGRGEGQRAWTETASLRLQHNDLATVDFLYAEFIKKGLIRISPRCHLIQSLIQWHYKTGKHSARAAEILFPDLDRISHTSAESDPGRHSEFRSVDQEDESRSRFSIRFLQSLWERKADSDWLLLNFRRVIVAAKLRCVKLGEGIFVIVIRSLASIGNMAAAQAVYDEMVFYHQVEATFFSRTLLLRGYARISQWTRVERDIESLHDLGLSRTRPHGYALMINAVLQEYAARASIEQFQNFLINAISCWGLIPTSAVSATTVQAYLSQQRYDLVREWMETLQVLFPKLETETNSFQWLLGNLWQRAGANCQEIEEALKAVAYRNPGTRLKSRSVPMIHEALSRDLAAKLDAAQGKTELPAQTSLASSTEDLDFTSNHRDNDFTSAATLDEYLNSAFSLAASTVSQNRTPTSEVMDLYRQAAAVQRVNTFLTSSNSSEAVDQFTFSDLRSDMTDTDSNVNKGTLSCKSNLAHLRDSIPTILTTEFLPDTFTITAAILEFYRTRSARDLPTDHALLLWICEKLLHADRGFDAVYVLEKVYGNSLVRKLTGLDEDQGSGGGDSVSETAAAGRRVVMRFNIEFYEFWMRLARLTKNLRHWIKIVEEVSRLSYVYPSPSADASLKGEEALQVGVKITYSFVFLTRTVAAKLLSRRWSSSRPFHTEDAVEEVAWLYEQLERRREQQIGRKEQWGQSNRKFYEIWRS
jgi:hypothetical protein